jgi:hypothetical protein
MSKLGRIGSIGTVIGAGKGGAGKGGAGKGGAAANGAAETTGADESTTGAGL